MRLRLIEKKQCNKLAQLLKLDNGKAAFVKTQQELSHERTNQALGMLEIITTEWKNATIPKILQELELRKKITLHIVKNTPSGKDAERKYGQIIYQKS